MERDSYISSIFRDRASRNKPRIRDGMGRDGYFVLLLVVFCDAHMCGSLTLHCPGATQVGTYR